MGYDIELKIKGLKKTVTIDTSETKKLSREYVEKLTDMEEYTEKDISNREKLKKTNKLF